MYINRRCINNRMFTLVYMQCVQSCRLIFHAAVFRHLSLKIMAAIKHFPAFFPALFWCVCVCAAFPQLSFGAHFAIFCCHFSPHFGVCFLPLSQCLPLPLCVYQIWFAAISLLFSRHHPLYPVPLPHPRQLLVLCPLMFGNLFECQQLFLSWGGGLLYPKVYHVGYSIGKQLSRL